jgi:hypothetical protein
MRMSMPNNSLQQAVCQFLDGHCCVYVSHMHRSYGSIAQLRACGGARTGSAPS